MSRDRERYVKLRQSFWRHPSIRLISKGARWAYVAGLSYCMDEESDGVVAGHVARGMLDATTKEIAELVAVGLWEAHGSDYLISDYLKHNKSKAEMASEREAKARGGRKGGGSNRATDGATHVATQQQLRSIKIGSNEDEEELTPPTPPPGGADDGPRLTLAEQVDRQLGASATPGMVYRLLELLSRLHASPDWRPYLEPGTMCSASDRQHLAQIIAQAEVTAKRHDVSAMSVIAGEWVALIALKAAGELPRIGNVVAYFRKRFGTIEAAQIEAGASGVPPVQEAA